MLSPDLCKLCQTANEVNRGASKGNRGEKGGTILASLPNKKDAKSGKYAAHDRPIALAAHSKRIDCAVGNRTGHNFVYAFL